METIVTPETFQSSIEKTKPQRLIENLALWAIEYRRIRGARFTFEGHRYLERIYTDRSPNKCIQKAGQIGVSEYFVNESFWLAEQGWNSLVIFPASPQLYDFTRARVDRAIEESEHLIELSGKVDNAGMKRLGKGFIYYRGSMVTRDIKTIDADAIYLDELDEISPPMIPVAEKRLGHSKLKWMRATSTPTFPETGINKLYLQSDMNEWHIKCLSCGLQQPMDFFDNLVADSGQVLCRKCHNPLDRFANGEWMSKFPTRSNILRGYLVPKLACIRTNLADLIADSKKTPPEDVQAFYNFDLGLPYVPKGGAVQSDLLDMLRGDFGLQGVGNGCIMGIDIGSVINVWICEPQADGLRRTIYIDTVEEFEDLDRLMERYNVAVSVIDAQPETRKSIEFCNRHPGKAWYCRYTDSDLKDEIYGHFKADEVSKEVSANRTLAGDYFVDGLNERNILLPNMARDIPDLYSQIGASIRVIKKDSRGIARAFYVNMKPDHYFHAGVYMDLAWRIWKAGHPSVTLGRLADRIEMGTETRGTVSVSELLGNDREYLAPLEEKY